MWVRTAPRAMQVQLSALPPLTNTQCYLLSHFKGCFIPAKSQSSTDRHNSGLGFTSELSAFTLAQSPAEGQLCQSRACRRHRARGSHPAETWWGSRGCSQLWGQAALLLGHLHYGFLMGWHVLASPGSHLLLEPLRNPTLSMGTAAPIQPTQHLHLLCYSPSC